ncbi:tetratricopeptide repeat protein [Brachyspira sp.]|uniref:periplasmic flagellar collar protein FlcA n=1 Tax=Brachyspira sp. TaxID=1977261 RepID=UPI00260D0A65|nr:tetratricopeptide repeat protein [Brachyspira sp.]
MDNLDLPEDLGLDDNKESDDGLDLPEDLGDDKVSADIDNLDLPEDLDLDDNKESDDGLDLPEDLGDDKVSADIDNLDLPEDSDDDDDLGLPEDLGLDDSSDNDKVSADIDNLDLPEDLDSDDDDLGLPEDLGLDDSSDNDKVSADIDSLDLPEDKELEEKIEKDIKDNEKYDDIHSEKLPTFGDLPLPDSLPNIDENIHKENNDDLPDLPDMDIDENASDDLDIEGIADNLDDILEDEDSSLGDLDNILNNDDLLEEVKDKEEKPQEDVKDEEDDDLSLDSILDEQEETKDEEEKTQEEVKDEEDDDLSLDSILDEQEETKDEEEKTQEEVKDEEDDDLSLDSILDEQEETKDEEEKTQEEVKDEEDDDLSLDSILDEQEETKDEEEKTQNGNEDLDDIADEDKSEEDHELDLNDIDIDNEDSNIPSNNIVEGGTVLPAPETADSLPNSKYEDLGSNIDHDKVINSIRYLSPITQYHVLDAILNEKLDRDSMEYLLNALERGESSENITELLNKKLGLSLQEEGRKNILELIPIPNSLKDYAKIIRVAAVFLILFIAIVLFSFQFIYKPMMANKYYSQGLVSISKGTYDDAERNFAEGERYQPKQIKWYNKYARAYIARETFNEANNKIQSALNIKPRDFETRITYGFYYRKKGEKEFSQEDYILGEELYNDMLVYTEKKKEKETIYDERGLLMISRAKNMLEPDYYDIAYNNYRDMVNFFGDGVVPRKRVMLIKIYQDDYKQVKAIQNHINLLQSGYIDDEVYPKLAKYLLDKDDFYGSRKLFESLLAAYPKNLESVIGYADYETRLKHYDRAREILTSTALPIYESDPFYRGKEYVYNMLGQIYYNLGEYGNAVKNFNEALAINAAYPDANYNLGNVYFYKEKDYPKAKEHYQMAYDNLAPNLRSDKLLYNLSWIYYLDSEYDRAFEGFNALFQKNPSNSVVSYALGNSLLHLDKANLANGFYRNALSQILAKRDRLGRLEMRMESDFILVSYLASLYNNIGVAYAHNSTVTNNIINEQEAFKHFVLASEYFDQVRTSNIDLERMEKRTILIDNQNVGAASYNIMSMQGRRNLKQATVIDDYIPKDMNYLK